MIKKHSRTNNTGRYYWFTIVAANGQTLATSETYTTAAMRDKGIESVKKVVVGIASKEKWKEFQQKVLPGRNRDTFHLENAKGKIKKH